MKLWPEGSEKVLIRPAAEKYLPTPDLARHFDDNNHEIFSYFDSFHCVALNRLFV